MATLRLVPAAGNPVDVTRDTVLVGRDPMCDIVLADGSVSRRHARIERRGDVWFVVDLGSANGTFIDGSRATEMPLADGQEVRFGAVVHRVEQVGGEVGATVRTSVSAETVLHAAPAPATLTPASTPQAHAGPPMPRGRVTTVPMPPPDAGRPPAPRKRAPWAWIVGGCCGCLIILSLAGVGVYYYFQHKTTAGLEVIQQLVADVQRGDQQAAYGRLCQQLRAQVTLEQFIDLVNAHPGLARNASVSLQGLSDSTSAGMQVAVLLTASSGEQERATFGLISEDGGLRISSIHLEGTSSSS